MVEAKRGQTSPEVNELAKKEGVTRKFLKKEIAAGRIVVLKNVVRDIPVVGVGKGLRVKVNANIGVSETRSNTATEVKKALTAVSYGADTIMDLSIGSKARKTRKAVIKSVKAPLGTVPVYDCRSISEDCVFKAVERHLKDGVDFVTVHCGVTKESVGVLKRNKRMIPVVSRGGGLIAEYILKTGEENPLYENFDYLLELAKKYDATLSLGDGLRPGAIYDATDKAQLKELEILGKLVKRARKASVQTMVEGPGHIPLDGIEKNVALEKKLCSGAPFYVLGPLVTDIGVGYDHIVGAIGGALAAFYGADFLCYVTPSEHMGLPGKDDVRLGVVASKIAAHAADITRGIDIGKDHSMSKARSELNWSVQHKYAIDPSKLERYRLTNENPCSMCDSYCPIKRLRNLSKHGFKTKGRKVPH